MHPAITTVLLATGVPACLARMWWIWWQSTCGGCGYQHKACACPPEDHLMRPRR